MKIVFINGSSFWGGAEKRHLSQAVYLKSKGHEVHFLAANEGLIDRLTEAGIPVAKFGFKSDIDIPTFIGLYRSLKRIRPDAVILNSERDLRLGGAAAKLAGIKVRVQCKEISGTKKNFRYRWTYTNLRTHTLCVADAIRRELLDLGWMDPDSIKVVHTYVDFDRFKPEGSRNLRKTIGAADGDIVIGGVARMSSIKGFEYLIDAMPEILKAHPTVKCVLVGTGRVEGELKAQTERLGLTKSVIFTGFSDKVDDAARSIDIAVYPSVHTEGLPHSVLEAMASGTPVVSTAVSGIPEAIVDGETGDIVPLRDSAALAKAVIALIDDPARRKRYSEAARKRAMEKFDIRDKLDELEKWLLSVC